MLPTEDAAWVGEELTRRFTLPRWLFTLTATDANRTALRIARLLTGRPKVLVFSYCYHGSVDEAFAVGEDGRTVSRAGNVGPPVDPAVTTRAIEFNDVGALEAALAHEDVACVLAEPAMTNMGIVLPERRLPRGAACADARARDAADHRRDPHVLGRPGRLHAGLGAGAGPADIGKAIGGGVPCGALGLSDDVAEGMLAAARPTTRTPAASAARWPATRSRSPPCARPSRRC